MSIDSDLRVLIQTPGDSVRNSEGDAQKSEDEVSHPDDGV